ncbi:hypothetical protein Btru_052347 [Bulinus truncatus]|nr:hypothetical protein Btru_052347 [Bulinus truncatus]
MCTNITNTRDDLLVPSVDNVGMCTNITNPCDLHTDVTSPSHSPDTDEHLQTPDFHGNGCSKQHAYSCQAVDRLLHDLTGNKRAVPNSLCSVVRKRAVPNSLCPVVHKRAVPVSLCPVVRKRAVPVSLCPVVRKRAVPVCAQ